MMSVWNNLTPREMWDIVDSFYLKNELEVKDLLRVLEVEHEEYLRLRKNNLPVPLKATKNLICLHVIKPQSKPPSKKAQNKKTISKTGTSTT